MAEEIKTIPVTFANKGIVLKSSPDEIPLDAYSALVNVITDRENSLAVRKGMVRLNNGLPSAPYSTYLMKDYEGNIWRYAICERKLYIAQVYPVPTPFSAVPGGDLLSDAADPRALFTSYTLSGLETNPYMFMADGTILYRHRGGSYPLRRVGIPRPDNPIQGAEFIETNPEIIESCQDYTQWTAGDSSLTGAPLNPSLWWIDSASILLSRIYYAKWTYLDALGDETCASGISNPPIWVPAGKRARAFWKHPDVEVAYTAITDGDGGTAFADIITNFPAGARVYQIKIWHGQGIDKLQFIYEAPDGSYVAGPPHGGVRSGIDNPGGTLAIITLQSDEYITGISGTRGWLDSADNYIVRSIAFTTNKRTLDGYGVPSSHSSYNFTIPDGTSTESHMCIGLKGRAGRYVFAIGLAYLANTYTAADTAPVDAVSWNLYLGTDPDHLYLANSTPMDLADIYDEPLGGPEQGTAFVFCNVGEVTQDAAGVTGNAILLSVTGDGAYGRAVKAFTNEYGNEIVRDLGSLNPNEYISAYVKFSNAEALANIASISLVAVISDIAGDTGENYQYYAVGSVTDFDAFVAGEWNDIQVAKSDFIFSNYSGQTFDNLDWHTVSAIGVQIITIDPATGGKTCNVSFDEITYLPSGNLTGNDLQWTYTYFNSLTGTESDYADVFNSPLGVITDAKISLAFPLCPSIAPPAADPDTIKIYRMGGSITQFQLVGTMNYTAGAIPGPFEDNVADSELGDPLETDNQLPPDYVRGVEVADNRLWTWGGSITTANGTVVPEPPNRLRFSKRVTVESFPAENYIYVGSGSEQIQRVMEHDGELFVFTLTRVFRIAGSTLIDYQPLTTSLNQGLVNPHGLARGTRGIFMQAYDGIYEYPSGKKISETINQAFKGEMMNGIPPIVKGRENYASMAFWDSKLYFTFPMSNDPLVKNDGTYIWDIIYERWHFYSYGAQNLFSEPITNILIGANIVMWTNVIDGLSSTLRIAGNWAMQLEEGFFDQLSDGDYGISWVVDTREYDLGMPDQEKQFIDYVFDVDTQGYAIAVELGFDGDTPEPMGSVITLGREQKILPVVVGESEGRFARRTKIRMIATTLVSATGLTRFFKIMHRILIEPIRHRSFVTQWDDCGVASPKFFREVWIDLDTFGAPLEEIQIHVDQALGATIRAQTVCSGRTRFYYGLPPDLRGTLVRLKIIPSNENEVKLYGYQFRVIEEPPSVNSFQMPWSEEQWPYPKLWKEAIFDIDTNNLPIGFNFWLDGEIVQSFDLQCDGRRLITKSLDQDLFGKLGRITVNESYLDAVCCLPQGVRVYGVRFVVDHDPADVTFSDTYDQLFNYDRTKILRRLWLAMKNPDSDVTFHIYAEDVLQTTKVVTAEIRATGFSKRRIDLESAIKGRVFRIIASSPFPFQLYWDKSEVEMKSLNGEDGYARLKLVPPQTL